MFFSVLFSESRHCQHTQRWWFGSKLSMRSADSAEQFKLITTWNTLFLVASSQHIVCWNWLDFFFHLLISAYFYCLLSSKWKDTNTTMIRMHQHFRLDWFICFLVVLLFTYPCCVYLFVYVYVDFAWRWRVGARQVKSSNVLKFINQLSCQQSFLIHLYTCEYVWAFAPFSLGALGGPYVWQIVIYRLVQWKENIYILRDSAQEKGLGFREFGWNNKISWISAKKILRDEFSQLLTTRKANVPCDIIKTTRIAQEKCL